MELPQPTLSFRSADELTVADASHGTAIVDPDRFVSLVLGLDGVPKALVLVMPVSDASCANGSTPSVTQHAAHDADLLRSLSSRSWGATEPTDGHAGRNGGGDDGLISEIVGRLFVEMPSVAPPNGQRPRARPSDDRDAISDAEARVLRYLPTNLTASEIASTLCVSVNTVKTHMRHIYAKLDAHRRREAVDRARALGLLTSSSRVDATGIPGR
jgi:LuxR family transcriptional regulator, maltose regulon positive regulatory protein